MKRLRWMTAVLAAVALNAFGQPDGSCEKRILGPPAIPQNLREILTPWFQFRASALSNYAGFEMRRAAPTHLIEVSMADFDSTPFLEATTWRSPEAFFTFVDSGFRRLERISHHINYLAFRHLKENPTANLRVNFSRSLKDRVSALAEFRWQIHDAVLDKYSETKHYLDGRDLFLLKFGNVWSGNSDVFALLKGSVFSVHEPLPPFELERRLALTIQISYFGDENYFKPTSRGIMRPLKFDDYTMSFDLLPFEYRLPEEQRPLVRDELAKHFDLKHSCELVRYASFTKIPSAVHARFLYQAFSTIKKRGMKTVFAAGDVNTIRLFRRYGFTKILTLPLANSREPEFLTYLNVETPEYIELLNKLARQSESTEVLGGYSDY